MARAYWAFLRRMSLGIIRVHYEATSRTVTAFGRIPLLRFGAPQYETEEGLRPGHLADRSRPARRARGPRQGRAARLDPALRPRRRRRRRRRAPGTEVRLIAQVEVENFYPGIRGRGRFARFGAWFYAQTQLRIHVIVCNAYLRSLPRLDFPDIDRTEMPSDQPGRGGGRMSAAAASGRAADTT